MLLRPDVSQRALLACTGLAVTSAACATTGGAATASLGSARAPADGPGRPVSWVSTSGGLYGYSGEVCELGEYLWRSLWLHKGGL